MASIATIYVFLQFMVNCRSRGQVRSGAQRPSNVGDPQAEIAVYQENTPRIVHSLFCLNMYLGISE